MQKWVPYTIAAVLGVGVAVLAFGPGTESGSEAQPISTTDATEVERTVENVGKTRYERTPEEVVADALANPAPPPGTLRPQNQAEIAHAARLARPFNQHTAYVGAFWNMGARLLKDHPELQQEFAAMVKELREQARLENEDLDIPAAIAKERALVARARVVAAGDTELTGVLDYLDESTQAVLDGTDPTAVLKPKQKAAAAGR